MLTKAQREIIDQYVNPDYYYVDRLAKYLEMHDIVGNEVFQYCDKGKDNSGGSTYPNWLDHEDGYEPLPVDSFVRRIPFYFYTRDHEIDDLDHSGTLGYLYSASVSRQARSKGDKFNFEEIYEVLEYAFYKLHLPLEKIFNYWIDQTGVVSGNLFFQWYDYLKLNEGSEPFNYFPERFITAYNEALERHGRDPIIYEMRDMYIGEYFLRRGTQMEFEGQFPCDNNGKPIMKWIGIDAKNIGRVKCTCEKSESGRLIIQITPESVIRLLNIYNGSEDDDDYWYQIYAGPLCMEFDYTILKQKRKALKFTQQEVAEAVGSTVRTYQKWENGETTPDGHYLLRLMNWLEIPDAQTAVKFVNV